MGRPRDKAPAKPHARAKARARDVAAADPDIAWADGLFERMLAACHPFQRAVVEDHARRISVLAGRGGGKTTALRVRALRKASRRQRARIAYVATSRPEAERLNWEPMKALLEALGEMDNFEFHESKLICTCRRTGGTYQFFGADDKREVNKLRGQPFDEFQVDEAASHDPVLLEELLDRAIGPRLGERDGAIVLAGTPGHVLYGLFYDVTRPGSEIHQPHGEQEPGWDGYSSHAWDLFDVMALRDSSRYPAMVKNYEEALRQKARKGWSDDNPIWLREYRRRWAADNTTSMYAYQAHKDGTPFNAWDPLAGWTKEARMTPAALEAAVAALPKDLGPWLFGYGQDLGSRDPYALDVFAFSPHDPMRRLWHVFSFDQRRMYARTIAELLIGPDAVARALRGEVYTREDWGGLFRVTDWPVAIVADLAALGEAVIDELRVNYGISVKAAEKRGKFGAIEVFNGDLVDGRMFVLAGSGLEEQISTLQWKPDEYGQPKEDRSARNDHADAATYIRTSIGGLFSAAPEKRGEEREAPAARPRPPATRPDDGRRKPRGEFDALLDDDFSGIGY